MAAGVPRDLLVVFDISPTAVFQANAVGMQVTEASYLTVTAPDVVNALAGPITSNLKTIEGSGARLGSAAVRSTAQSLPSVRSGSGSSA